MISSNTSNDDSNGDGEDCREIGIRQGSVWMWNEKCRIKNLLKKRVDVLAVEV